MQEDLQPSSDWDGWTPPNSTMSDVPVATMGSAHTDPLDLMSTMATVGGPSFPRKKRKKNDHDDPSMH